MTNVAPVCWTPLARREARQATVLVLGLAALLAAGFIPTAKGFVTWLVRVSGLSLSPSFSELSSMLGFPALALFFHYSMPRSVRDPSPEISPIPGPGHGEWRRLTSSLWIPAILSMIFGAVRGYPSIFSALGSPTGRLSLFWTILAIPLGEELLFRGWIYGILSQRWKHTLLSATNPLPVAVWGSALAFALWHLQNLAIESPALVTFQLLYTFWTGIWLGYLRWRTGKLGLSIAAHLLLNLASNLI